MPSTTIQGRPYVVLPHRLRLGTASAVRQQQCWIINPDDKAEELNPAERVMTTALRQHLASQRPAPASLDGIAVVLSPIEAIKLYLERTLPTFGTLAWPTRDCWELHSRLVLPPDHPRIYSRVRLDAPEGELLILTRG